MFRYIHDVNAKVEQGRRYLTDVVKIALEVEDIMEEEEKVGEQYRVTAYPAVQVGTEVINTIPVHPKTESEEKEVPTYGVPSVLKVLVRANVEEIAHETAGQNQRNWVEETVVVNPIADSVFNVLEDAVRFYEELAHQLAQGDDIRHYNRPGVISAPYDNYNSRYPSF